MKSFLKYSILVFCMLLFFPLSGQDSVETIVREAESDSNIASISIKTNITGVEIYINNLYKGIAPLVIDDVLPSVYSVQLKKDGWKRKSVFVEVKAHTQTNLYFELVPITGFLRVESDLDDATISVDGSIITQGNSTNTGFIELQEGVHTVEIQKFGWETQSKSITVFESFLTEVDFVMERTLFDVSHFSANPQRFNPLSPGALGRSRFNFSITAPGSATMSIIDTSGNLVRSIQYNSLTSETHSVTWDGKNAQGAFVPEGEYRASLEATPASGWHITSSPIGSETIIISTSSIVVDTSLFYPITGANAGGTASGIPSARHMPVGTSLISFNGIADFSVDTGYNAVPLSLSTVFNPFSLTEFTFRLGLESETNGNIPFFVGGAIKISYNISNVYLGFLSRYTYITDTPKVPTYSESGLAFGLLAGIENGMFLFSFSEEVVLDFQHNRNYAKTGLSMKMQRGYFSSDLWATIHSPFSSKQFQFLDTVQTGLDFFVLLPNSTILPNIGAVYTYSKDNGHYVGCKFGFGILLL